MTRVLPFTSPARLPILVPLLALPLSMLLVGCSSTSKPPTVDEAMKRPANNPMVVELQVCKTDLYNSRLQAAETTRDAQAAAASLAHQVVREQILSGGNIAGNATRANGAASQADGGQPNAQPALANSVYAIGFDAASPRPRDPIDGYAALLAEAKTAPRIVVRASRRERTSASVQTLTSAKLAGSRAVAVRDAMLAAGIDSHRIRIEIESAEDAASTALRDRGSNSPWQGQKGEVEVEVYRALPMARASGTVPGLAAKGPAESR